jgi:nucleoside-diphosphate-sugar epimerase
VTERIDPARFRRSEVPDIFADTRRLRALGWKPRVSFDQSLADTAAWWRKR